MSEASQWMLSFLHAGGPGQTLTLRDVMDPAYTGGEVVVTDDCRNESPPGSNCYVWGFEVCLWHHARNKHIEPGFGDEAEAPTACGVTPAVPIGATREATRPPRRVPPGRDRP